MKFSETTLPFLAEDIQDIFGPEEGAALFQAVEERYQALLHQGDDYGVPAMRDHLQRKLFPTMAYYQALRAQGMEQEQALAYVRQETRKAAERNRGEMERLAGMPFAYTMYRLGVKGHMKKNFPPEGWQTEWVRCDGKEIHFNLHRCVYWELTQQQGCPELCCVYCENDEIAFSGLLPKIRFERAGTLGGGADCCDFHFIKT